jgi:hypothetical protein
MEVLEMAQYGYIVLTAFFFALSTGILYFKVIPAMRQEKEARRAGWEAHGVDCFIFGIVVLMIGVINAILQYHQF